VDVRVDDGDRLERHTILGMPPAGIGSFHVHRGHEFEGFQIEPHGGRPLLVARCRCGERLDVAEAAFAPCPDCAGAVRTCVRCGGTGRVIDHAALRWRLPTQEERDADDP
jgi:hypothetical protein